MGVGEGIDEDAPHTPPESVSEASRVSRQST